MPGVLHRLRLGLKLGIEARQKLAADRPDGACGHDAFGRAAGSHQGVDARARNGGHQRAGNVAGGIERDAGARRQDAIDQLAMARLLQHEDGQLGDVLVESLGERGELLAPSASCGSILPRAGALATNFSM